MINNHLAANAVYIYGTWPDGLHVGPYCYSVMAGKANTTSKVVPVHLFNGYNYGAPWNASTP